MHSIMVYTSTQGFELNIRLFLFFSVGANLEISIKDNYHYAIL